GTLQQREISMNENKPATTPEEKNDPNVFAKVSAALLNWQKYARPDDSDWGFHHALGVAAETQLINYSEPEDQVRTIVHNIAGLAAVLYGTHSEKLSEETRERLSQIVSLDPDARAFELLGRVRSARRARDEANAATPVEPDGGTLYYEGDEPEEFAEE